MYVFEGDNVNEIFIKSVGRLIKNGENKTPRGLKTVELSPVMIRLYNPKNKFLFHPWRKLNPFSIVSELVWIVGGYGDVVFPAMFNKQLLKWVDDLDHWVKKGSVVLGQDGSISAFIRKDLDGVEFNAPYGKRIRKAGSGVDQLIQVMEELRKDPDSRRAVISLWNHDFDRLDRKTVDRPCNFSLIFKITEKKLNLTVINRSNDILLGLFNVNIPIFTSIQEMVGAMLGVEVGEYYHFTNSFHMYLDHPLTKQMKLNFNEDKYGYIESLAKAERFIPFHYYKEDEKFFEDGRKKDKEVTEYTTNKTPISKHVYLNDCQNMWHDIKNNRSTKQLRVSGSNFRRYTLDYLRAYLDMQKAKSDVEKDGVLVKLVSSDLKYYNTDWEILAFMMLYHRVISRMGWCTNAVNIFKSIGPLNYDIALTIRENERDYESA